jgi:hypothetical protein
MGWTIEPNTNVSATTEDGKFKVVFGNREGLPTTAYTIQYTEGTSCGKFIVNQTGNAEPPQPTCNPCRDCMGPIRENFYIKNESGRSVDIYASVKIKMWKTIPGQEYPKYIGVYDYIENGDPIPTITLDNQGTSREIKAENLHFGSESTVSKVPCALPCEWECIGEETDYMNGQTIVEASVYNSDNSGGLTCSISPTTFSTGTTYTVTILQQ